MRVCRASDALSLRFVFIDILGSFELFSALERAGRAHYSTCHCHIEVRPSSQQRPRAVLDTVILQRYFPTRDGHEGRPGVLPFAMTPDGRGFSPAAKNGLLVRALAPEATLLGPKGPFHPCFVYRRG